MNTSKVLTRRQTVASLGAVPMLAAAPSARAAEPVRVGLVLTMSGPFASYGEIMASSAKLFLATQGDALLGGVPVELIVRDDGGANPDTAKRLVQELITRDHVQYIGGFQWTPNANAIASLLNQAKTPCVLFNAAGAALPRQSPWFVRTSFTQWQTGVPMGQWAADKGYKTAYILVADFTPGLDSEGAFTKGFTSKGGQIIGSARMPIQNPNFIPYLLRAKDAKPDVVFAFHPGGYRARRSCRPTRRPGCGRRV